MAESSPSPDSPSKGKKVTIIGPSPEKNKPTSKDKGKGVLIHDFHFKLQPSTKFRHAIAALSNFHFNPSRKGLLEVDDSGLSITVYNTTQFEPGCEEEQVYGFLRLYPEFFNHFECINPVSKMICLDRVLVSLTFVKDEWLLSVFSRHGSDLVTVAFEPIDKNEVPRGIPSNVELTDVNPEYPRFPDIIYGFEASILSSQLIPLITDLLTLPPDSLPDFVTLDLQHASVRLTVGEKTVGKAADRNELWFVWPYWETLRRAASTSKECSVYQTTEPPENLMLLFKLTDPDDTITFTRGTYSCNKKVSCLAFLSALT